MKMLCRLLCIVIYTHFPKTSIAERLKYTWWFTVTNSEPENVIWRTCWITIEPSFELQQSCDYNVRSYHSCAYIRLVEITRLQHWQIICSLPSPISLRQVWWTSSIILWLACIFLVAGDTGAMGRLLPDTHNCGLRMHREFRERFPRHNG